MSKLSVAEQPYTYSEIEAIAAYLKSKTRHNPTIGIICGSGLGGLADQVDDAEDFDYSSIPKFPVSTVPGHAGKLVFGKLSGKTVVCMKGRFHFYEGYPMWKVTLPVRVLKLLGVQTLIVTNAAGGLNPAYKPGDVMAIKDHVFLPGMVGFHPLQGHNMHQFGERFTPMSDAYTPKLRDALLKIGKRLVGESMKEGVYCMVSGPTYESPSEASYLRLIGGDAVGMSTAPEVVVARHCGMQIVGISLVTNKVILANDGDGQPAANHAEVLETGKRRAADMEKIVSALVGEI
ncbi:purine nucleoside phosphorylase-like isoform X2 [Oscarella lobularis]|uniref:purine nucleoside phosphorylase-like isoform X2 n=1 Tax=Oscarella lobularis TaxID=121494 RepID=UPI003313C03E